MKKQSKPFWANKNQIPKLPNPQVIVTFDLDAKRINIASTTENGDLAIGMLIDALAVLHRARCSQEKNKIILASPGIIKPN